MATARQESATTTLFSPPTAGEAYDSFDASASPSPHDNHDSLSFGWLDRVEPSIMATCFPCFSIARFSASTRIGFTLVFLAVVVLYCGGIVSFAVAARVTDPVVQILPEDPKLYLVVAFAWGSYLIGPWATIIMDGLLWSAWFLYKALSEDDPQDRIYASSTSIILIAVHFAVHLVLAIALSHVISKLRIRKTRSDLASCCWGCYCCCFTTCAFGSTVTAARKARAMSCESIPEYRA